MPSVIVIAQVIEVSTLTSGYVKSAAGVTMAYSDATLSTRGVELSLSEWITGVYDGATISDVCSLTAIYEQGLDDVNAENELTAAGIKTKLQTYNCCAQKQTQKDLDEKFKGQKGCPELVEDSKLMRNLIKSICGIVPEDETISGKQATYQFTITGIGNPAFNMDVTVTIGSASYVMSFDNTPARTQANIATAIADFINNLYQVSYDYYAEASGANVIVSGIGFDDDNGVAVTVSITNGTASVLSPNALAGGTAAVLQGENPINNQEIQVVLDKLNSLCKVPCDKIFQN